MTSARQASPLSTQLSVTVHAWRIAFSLPRRGERQGRIASELRMVNRRDIQIERGRFDRDRLLGCAG